MADTRRSIHLFLVAAAVAVAGCVAFSPDGGFGVVQDTAKERLGHDVAWVKTDAQRETVEQRVAELLGKSLSVEDAVQIALLNNRGLQAAYFELGISEADLVQAGRFPNPHFSMLRASRVENEVREYKIEQALAFNIFALITMPLALEVEGRRFEQTKRQVAMDVLRLAAETRRAYFQAVAAEETVRYMRQVKEAADASSELARRMARVGNWNKLDQAREQGFYADAALNLARVEQGAMSARERLIRLLGLWGEQTAIKLPERIPDLPRAAHDLANVEREAMAQRLDLQAIRAQTEALAQNLGLTRTTRFINVLELGPARVLEGPRDAPYKYGYEISFQLPLFDWGGARVAKAEAIYMQAVNRAAERLINARSEVREAYSAYRSAYDIAKHYRDEVVPIRKRIAEENLLRYNGMLIGVFELLADVQRQIASANGYIESLRDFWLADGDLAMAMLGKPAATPIGQVSVRGSAQAISEGDEMMFSRRAFFRALGLAGGAAAAAQVNRMALAALPEIATMDKSATQPPLVPPNGRPYNPVVTLNSWTLPWRINAGVKEFHLVAEPVVREMAPGMKAHLWGYNGQSPGPTIEVVEGDRIRIFVTNRLPEHTTMHWHGQRLPNGMDGIGGLTQKHIGAGKTFVYEFVARRPGTFMYHPHADEMTQMAMGMMGMWVTHPKGRHPLIDVVDRDFCFLLNAFDIEPGSYTPKINTMLEFNLWAWNSRVFPGIDSLNVRLNDKVRIRIGNLTMTNHPIHLHGHEFLITGTDGGPTPKSTRCYEVTADVAVGQKRQLEFLADEEGDWAFHCHKSHHTMNAMGHEVPTMIGVDHRGLARQITRLIPDYMVMGERGMADMAEMEMPLPDNTLPMMSGQGPYGAVEMGGMFTVVKVRREQKAGDYTDSGWCRQPHGTQAFEWAGPMPEPHRFKAEGAQSMPAMSKPAKSLELRARKPNGRSGH